MSSRYNIKQDNNSPLHQRSHYISWLCFVFSPSPGLVVWRPGLDSSSATAALLLVPMSRQRGRGGFSTVAKHAAGCSGLRLLSPAQEAEARIPGQPGQYSMTLLHRNTNINFVGFPGMRSENRCAAHLSIPMDYKPFKSHAKGLERWLCG